MPLYILILCFAAVFPPGTMVFGGPSDILKDWLGWRTENDASNGLYSNSGVPLLKIPFEELDPEEKFLVEASKIIGLPLDELDVCQQKLVMRLKASCSTLSDEQISKLAVHLLNCQSSVEGRKIFECSDEMNLKECTKNMNADDWNSYHIISNRARAVCYAARQQQFRTLAEMTINKLMGATHAHLSAIDAFQDKQKIVQDAAIQALGRLSSSRQEAINSFRNLRVGESALSLKLNSNIAIAKETETLLNGNYKLVMDLMIDLQKNIDNAGKQMEDYLRIRIAEHKQLLNDLIVLKQASVDIKIKMDESTSKFEERELNISQKLLDLSEKLMTVNKSLEQISEWIDVNKKTLRPALEEMEKWLGNDGNELKHLIGLVPHIICFILAMIFCSFLFVPALWRWLIVFGAFLNWQTSIAYEIPNVQSLQMFYSAATVVFLSYLIFNYIRLQWENMNDSEEDTINSTGLNRVVENNNLNLASPLTTDDNEGHFNVNGPRLRPQCSGLSPVEEDPEDIGSSKVKNWLAGHYNFPKKEEAKQKNGFIYPVSTPFRTPKFGEGDNNSTIVSNLSERRRTLRSSTPLTNSTSRSLCAATTKVGHPCRNVAMKDNTLCRLHSTMSR